MLIVYVNFENIITGIHFNNKNDNQKLKHARLDVKLVNTNVSVGLSTNNLLSKILLHLQNLDKEIKNWFKNA